MVTLKQHQLKAFTLVETIVSLILISVSFGICFLLFNQVSTKQNIKQEAAFIAGRYLAELEEGKHEMESHSFQEGELEISVQIEQYEEVESALVVQLSVLQKEKVLYSTKNIILIGEVDEN